MNNNLKRILIVGAGGFIGAALRYIVTGLSSKGLGDNFPFGTLIVNVIGGLLIGFIMEASLNLPISANLRIFLTTGILGGLTTFSTFSYETVSLVSDGRYLLGGLNAGLNVFLALAAVWAGTSLARVML